MFLISCKKSIQTIFWGFLLGICVLFTLGQNSVLAGSLAETGVIAQESPAISEVAVNLESEVDRFLTSIPSGYFTIANVAGLKTRLKNPQTVLVDVREPSEYKSGHIPNAINIPLRTLAQNLNEIPRDRPVVLYCSTGYRSAMGVMTLHLLGYENVQGFPPSFAGWKASGERIASN
ncbi:rhodanese-like domain-containing protein [Lyngbya sp. CCAP 1446/10]|uniref:rhodanese-like domain-containing protein n=1 Tax=Lyngbya sp. CCAP 1446/10 TaxID=439293 RepID=UPI00223721DA|nr:rhodanese-like domain-containing protein [Lyngbya sp. CCAP 1446/10]MCW6053845.1 rhodanese-like domain-containing protein [Lyngbya sp. CCAP 1446/10]